MLIVLIFNKEKDFKNKNILIKSLLNNFKGIYNKFLIIKNSFIFQNTLLKQYIIWQLKNLIVKYI